MKMELRFRNDKKVMKRKEDETYLDCAVSILESHVDGEVSIYGTHLVPESLSNTLDHVLDVRADSADGGNLFSYSKPFANTEGILSNTFQLHMKMTEVPDKSTAWPGYTNNSVFDCKSHPLREGNSIMGLDQLHDRTELPETRE